MFKNKKQKTKLFSDIDRKWFQKVVLLRAGSVLDESRLGSLSTDFSTMSRDGALTSSWYCEREIFWNCGK